MNTQEQEHIFQVCSNLKNKEIAAIIAPAGGGKTTTLVELAKILHQKKILYLAYNKSIKDEASKRFPSNVTVATAHGLAYKILNIANHPKWRLREQDYNIHELAEILQCNDYLEILKTKRVFDKFLNSNAYGFSKKDLESNISIANACKLYGKMLCGEIDITHSFYFKQFERQRNTLDYDMVFLDEAQDSNDVTLSMYFALNGAKVLVGDPHQAIYAFRGSVNAFKKITATHKLYLTQCFRCNQNIVNRANEILSLKGSDKDFDIVSAANNDDKIETHAIITRTNAKIIELLANAEKDNKQYIFLKNPKEFFNDICDLADFLYPKEDVAKIKKDNKFLKYKNADNFLNIMDESKDINLISVHNIVKRYKRGVFMIYQNAKTMWNKKKEIKKGDGIYLMTAHASKGLEFDEVTLTKDFPDIEKMRNDGKYTFTEVNEEINLYYVAVTRAKKYLNDLSKNLKTVDCR